MSRAPEEAVAVLFVDMDRFQVLNESLGYEVGDLLLCLCAERLEATVAPGDSVAHLHGDEFGVLLTELEHTADALQVAQEGVGTVMVGLSRRQGVLGVEA